MYAQRGARGGGDECLDLACLDDAPHGRGVPVHDEELDGVRVPDEFRGLGDTAGEVAFMAQWRHDLAAEVEWEARDPACERADEEGEVGGRAHHRDPVPRQEASRAMGHHELAVPQDGGDDPVLRVDLLEGLALHGRIGGDLELDGLGSSLGEGRCGELARLHGDLHLARRERGRGHTVGPEGTELVDAVGNSHDRHDLLDARVDGEFDHLEVHVVGTRGRDDRHGAPETTLPEDDGARPVALDRLDVADLSCEGESIRVGVDHGDRPAVAETADQFAGAGPRTDH